MAFLRNCGEAYGAGWRPELLAMPGCGGFCLPRCPAPGHLTPLSPTHPPPALFKVLPCLPRLTWCPELVGKAGELFSFMGIPGKAISALCLG